MSDLAIKTTVVVLVSVLVLSTFMLFYTNTLLWAIPAAVSLLMLMGG